MHHARDKPPFTDRVDSDDEEEDEDDEEEEDEAILLVWSMVAFNGSLTVHVTNVS